MQMTIADWVSAQHEADLDRELSALRAEADEAGRCIDYDEEDHALRQHEYLVEDARLAWP